MTNDSARELLRQIRYHLEVCKDARSQQLCGMINDLLSENADGDEREVAIRCYLGNSNKSMCLRPAPDYCRGRVCERVSRLPTPPKNGGK